PASVNTSTSMAPHPTHGVRHLPLLCREHARRTSLSRQRTFLDSGGEPLVVAGTASARRGGRGVGGGAGGGGGRARAGAGVHDRRAGRVGWAAAAGGGHAHRPRRRPAGPRP